MKSGIEVGDNAPLESNVTVPLLSSEPAQADENSFGAVVSLVNRRSKIVVLSDGRTGASIAVWPAMQGRILTSTVGGTEGLSFGWVNHELISSGEVCEHVNSVGGEDRIWLGPEGGQYSIFFAPGTPFDLDHWYAPPPIDTEPFDTVRKNMTSVTFRKVFRLGNYSGAHFHVRIDRIVRLLSQRRIWSSLGVMGDAGIKAVGFESDNTLTNLSPQRWSKDTGLLSLWVLGQFQSNPQTTIILPIRRGPRAQRGIPVTTDYFGAVPASRIDIQAEVVLFKADANYRSKLGLSILRAKGVLGSYDAKHRVLTIVQYSQPAGFAEYVNSSWQIQTEPYRGDVANCYNDGPSSVGHGQLGKFYELESSSPAKALGPGEAVTHLQRTIHLVGTEQQLEPICRATLGQSLSAATSWNT